MKNIQSKAILLIILINLGFFSTSLAPLVNKYSEHQIIPSDEKEERNSPTTVLHNNSLPSNLSPKTTYLVTAMGVFSDQGIDTDLDGLYNFIQITAEFDILEAGSFEFRLRLEDNHTSYEYLEYYEVFDEFSSGIQNISFTFPIRNVYSRKINTTYVITEVSIYSLTVAAYVFWKAIDWYTTELYSYSDCDPPSAFLTHLFADNGNDTDGNNKFNNLVIFVEINITKAGTYKLRALLRSNSENFPFLKWGNNSMEFSEGKHSIPLLYNPAVRYYELINITFNIQIIELYNSNNALIDETSPSYTTREYHFTEFDVPNLIVTGKYLDFGNDTDSDGLFNELIVQIEVNSSVSGNYSISVHVKSNSDVYVFTNTETITQSYLVGLYNVSFNFTIRGIHSFQTATNFTIIQILVEDGEGEDIYEIFNAYTTRVYIYNEFNPTKAVLTGRFFDYLLNSSVIKGGDYDELIIIVELNVIQLGFYKLVINLSSRTNYQFEENMEISVDLAQGFHNVSIPFTLTTLSTLYRNLSFEIREVSLYDLYDFNGERLSHLQNVYATKEYSIIEFTNVILQFPSDQEFISYANMVGLPGNGTEGDPYIIEGFSIVSRRPPPRSPFSSLLIEIVNTTLNVVIQNCTLIGAEIGIYLNHTRNIIIRNNVIRDSRSTIQVINSTNIIINNNTLIGKNEDQNGLSLVSSSRSHIKNNNIYGFMHAGIFLQQCHLISIFHNFLHDNVYGVMINGLPMSTSSECVIEQNILFENRYWGLFLNSYSEANIIQNNDFADNNLFSSSSMKQGIDQGLSNIFSQNFWFPNSTDPIDGNYEDNPAQSPNHIIPPVILSPNGGERITDDYTIEISAANDTFNQELHYDIYYSSNEGDSWIFISSDVRHLISWEGENSIRYKWKINATEMQGNSYLIRVVATNPLGFNVQDESDLTFRIRKTEDFFDFLRTLQINLPAIIFELILVIALLFIWKRQKKYRR